MDKNTVKNNFYVKVVKRILDFWGALNLIIIIWPILVIVGLLIAVESGFPVIYKQIRMGRDYKEFKIYKFRTMVKNADKIGPTSTAQGDSRITKLGRILRKTSLDELPQLFNIIKGDMSFIGYRPDVKRDSQNPQDIKYWLRPGITGYAQVNGRSSLTAEEKAAWEEKYVEDVSLLTDIKILLKTVKVVLFRSGTN